MKNKTTRSARIRDLLQANPKGMTVDEIKKALKLSESTELLSNALSNMRSRGQLIAIVDSSGLGCRRWAFNGTPKAAPFVSDFRSSLTLSVDARRRPESPLLNANFRRIPGA